MTSWGYFDYIKSGPIRSFFQPSPQRQQMSHRMQQVPTSTAALLISENAKPKKYTPEDGLKILKDLAPDGERRTRAARDEGVQILEEHFGVYGAETGSLIVTGIRGNWTTVLECLKRRLKDHEQNGSTHKRLNN